MAVLSPPVLDVSLGGQEASFRAATDLVSIYATVTDDHSRLVPNLARADFTVYDNGRKRPITYFSNDRQPFTVVVMLDRSGSMSEHFELVRRAGVAFVGQMLPADRGRIGTFSDRIAITPADFTGDHGTLVEALSQREQHFGESPVWTAIDRGITALLPEPGRRVVLAFTDGHNNTSGHLGITDVEDLVRRVRINGVMVYAIGFAATERSSSPGRFGPRTPPWAPPRGRFDVAPWPFTGTRAAPPDPGLKTLAEESGGGYFEMDRSDDLTGTFTRVAEELHRQYWLGITPEKLDGKVHKLEVRLRQTDLKVRTRKNYVATSDR